MWRELLKKCCWGSDPNASLSNGLPAILKTRVRKSLLSLSLSLSLLTQPLHANLSDYQNPHFTWFLRQENHNENLSSAAFAWGWDLPLEITGLLFQFLLNYFCKEIVLVEATQMLNLLQAVKIHRNWRTFLPGLLHCFTQGRMNRRSKAMQEQQPLANFVCWGLGSPTRNSFCNV